MRLSEPRAGVFLAELAPPGLRWARLAPGSCLPPARTPPPGPGLWAASGPAAVPSARPKRLIASLEVPPPHPAPPGGPRAETRETGEGKEEPGGRASTGRQPRGRVSSLEAGASASREPKRERGERGRRGCTSVPRRARPHPSGARVIAPSRARAPRAALLPSRP